jgi:hypothetical protein
VASMNFKIGAHLLKWSVRKVAVLLMIFTICGCKSTQLSGSTPLTGSPTTVSNSSASDSIPSSNWKPVTPGPGAKR